NQHRPVGLCIDPLSQPAYHLRLPKEKMLRITQLDISGAGDSRARANKIGRIENTGAVLTLIAARAFVAAMRARSDHVAVGEKAFVVDRIDLRGRALLEQAVLIELMIEVLGDLVVLRRMGAAEVIER